MHAVELDAAVCYCETCRRSSGGADMAWVTGSRATLRTYGPLQTWRAPDRAVRQFCPQCGSQLFCLDDDQPDTIKVAVGTLDDQSLVHSTQALHLKQRPRWDAQKPLGADWDSSPASGPGASVGPQVPSPGVGPFESMLISAQDAFLSIDAHGLITEWNHQAEVTLGWTYAEAVGRPMHELIIPLEMRSAHLYGMARLQRTGDGPVLRRRFEVEALHKNGHAFPIELSIAPLKMPDGIGATAFIRDISARQAVERELRSHQDLLQRTGELALVGAWTVDLLTDVVHWTPMVRRIHGVGDDFEPTLPSVIEFYEDGAQERLIAAFERGIQTGETWEIEAPLRTPGGERVWVRAIGETEFNAAGAPVRVVGALQDISARKLADESLRVLTQIVEVTPDLVVQAGSDGRVTYMNPAARRALGYDPSYDVTQHHFTDFNTPETTQRYASEVMPAVHQTGVWMGESAVVVQAGVIAVNHTVLAHRDANGKPIRYTAMMRDITAQTRARADLFRQQRTLSSIAEAIPDIIAVVDREGRYEFVNSAFERLMGLSRVDIAGQKIEDLMRAKGQAASMDFVRKALAGEPTSFELDLPIGGRQRNMVITLIPRKSERGDPDGFVAVLDDVTVHKQRELRLIGLSERDPLTDLLNRHGLESRLQRIARSPTAGVAVLFVDLDRFKPVNDTYGHPVGDMLLKAVAARFGRLVRPDDLVARVGGDEFVIVLLNMPGQEAANLVADKVVAAAAEPFDIGGREVQIGASVGVSYATDEPWNNLIERADVLLYQAKARGRGQRV
ncbi:PAS domain S-box protein [Acidovorax sp. LjRoot129]